MTRKITKGKVKTEASNDPMKTYIYGWDDEKEKIDFYVLPIFRSGDVITIREENYMVQSDFAL